MVEIVDGFIRYSWCCGEDGLIRGRFFFFQAEDGIRDRVRSRGLGDVYKRQRWWPIAPWRAWPISSAVPTTQTSTTPASTGAATLSLIHI